RPASCSTKRWNLRSLPSGWASVSSSPASRRLTRSAKDHYLSRSSRKERFMAEEVAVFAGGCFWCTEAVFNDVAGVTRVESGYTGGTDANPTYKQVCGGD